MRFLLTGLLALGAINALGHNDTTAHHNAPAIDATTDEAATPWTSLAPNDADSDFHFVVVTDRTGGARQGVFRDAMPKVNLLEPAFVVSVGDLIEGYSEDQAALDAEWDEFEAMIDQLNAPFFYTAGNHDMSNAVMAETWRSRFGPSYYHFTYKDVFFLVLNSELFGMVGNEETPVPGPYKQAEQMAFIEQALAESADARWTVVLVHQPLWDMDRIDPDWLRVEELLGGRDYTVFAGHYHAYKKTVRNDRNFITLATTGGGSSLRGPLHGEFDHVAWVTMRDDGPTIANVLLDGIEADDVATAQSRALIDDLSRAVSAEPVYQTGRLFRGGTFTYQVSNPAESPLTVSVSAEDSSTIRIAPSGEAITVAPGATEEIEIVASRVARVPVDRVTPAALSFQLTTQLNGRPFEMVTRKALFPQRKHAIEPIKREVAVDGSLDEWGRLRFAILGQRDLDPDSRVVEPSDASARFDLRYDDDSLYFAIDVIDDDVVASKQRPGLGQDAVIFTFDTRPEPSRLQDKGLVASATDGTLVSMAFDILTVEGEAPMAVIEFLSEARAELTQAGQRTESGYAIELQVPRSVLRARGGDLGNGGRLAVSLQDFDGKDRTPSNVYWVPNRFGGTSVAGSGTFEMSK